MFCFCHETMKRKLGRIYDAGKLYIGLFIINYVSYTCPLWVCIRLRFLNRLNDDVRLVFDVIF